MTAGLAMPVYRTRAPIKNPAEAGFMNKRASTKPDATRALI
jgi:hypothetical protein